MGWGDIITAGGQIVNDLYQSKGSTAEANSFTTAAQLAQQNAALTATSTKIQETQTARSVFQAEGTQMADVASAGFTESGSALDLLRSSANQGALAEALTNIQGAVTENSYAAQAGAYTGAAASAKESATGNTVGAIAALGGALVNNAQTLVSAGKTVVSGISSMFSSGGSDAALSSVSNALDTGGLADAGLTNPLDFTGSALDQAVSGGADLSEQIAASDIGIDTSELSIGTDLTNAEAGVASTFSDVSSSVADAASSASDVAGLGSSVASDLPFVGDAIAAANDVQDIISGNVGSIAEDVFIGSSSAVNSVISVASDIGNAIGSVFGSVICTAYYKLGYIRYRTWVGAQTYGAICNPIIFRGYYRWGKPVAGAITKFPWLARLLFPVFKSTIYQMASVYGVGHSTITGKLCLTLFRGISYIVGIMLPKHKEVKHALKA